MKCMLRLVLLTALNASLLQAGGFQLNESGTKAVGMASAYSAGSGGDASTLFYNPAGMTKLATGLTLTGGVSLISPGARFYGPTNYNTTQTMTELEAWSFPIPNFYAVYNMPESNLAFGLGVFVPFGLGTKFPDTWSGRNLAIRTYLETITINPNVAYSLLDGKLSVAAGLSYSMGRVELSQKATAPFEQETLVELTGKGNAMSWNLGVSYELSKSLRIGASYRNNIKIKYDGDVKYTANPAVSSLFVAGGGGTDLNLPYDFRLGLNYAVDHNLRVEFGLDYVGWSSYDTLKINFNRRPGAPFITNPDGTKSDNNFTLANPRNYQNQFVVRLGAEYDLSPTFTVRAGAVFDPAPVESKFTQPFLPDADRFGASVGFSYKISNSFTLDAAYFGINGFTRTVVGESRGDGLPTTSNNFDGVYKAWANIGSLGFSLTL
ncbi:MAG: outer membrane protein transport protein [Candidatus Kapabacteria bacterium]|nr:outer membrane protein transport protein [Candidatus Kapabacteria bacterium]